MFQVSVIIPTYNSSKYISEAIDSVLAQRFDGIDIIVVDDGSTDGTRDILRKYDKQIRYFYQQNAGAASARNKAISEAKGQYMAFLDADDLWLPDKLEKSISFIEKNDFDWICTSCFKQIGDENNRSLLKLANWVYDTESYSTKLLRDGLFFFASIDLFLITVVAKKKCFEVCGLFDQSLKIGEDHDLWLRFEEQGLRGGYLDEPLSIYRYNGLSLTKRRQEDGLAYFINVARKHAKLLGINRKQIRNSYAEFLWLVATMYLSNRNLFLSLRAFSEAVYYKPSLARRVISKIIP